MKRLLSCILAVVFSISVATVASAAEFSDVSNGSWYSEAVKWCEERGIMQGTSDTTFSPNSPMTRSMFATVLYRIAGSPVVDGALAYYDATQESWYADALVWASENRLMSGYSNGLFGINDPINREQIATVLWRQQGCPVVTHTNSFDDENDVSNYAIEAVRWAHSQGIINGIGANRINPQGNATRAEVASILYRALKGDENVPTISEKAELKTTSYNLNGVDFTMVLVEGGTFTMGSDNQDGQFSEAPAHKVTLSQDYLIGETEVTEALWNAVMGNGGGSTSMPKTSVTWRQAHDFIDRLNSIAHEQGLIPDDVNFILPTEAQWEFAAKGGNESKGYTYSGSNNINDVAVTYENSGSSSPIQVKSKEPNELGIYDMSGNAYEWVDDYGGNYSADAQTDPQNTSGRNYVKRGGSNYHSFSSEPYLFTTTGRYFYGSTDWTIGFRIGLQ